MRIVGQIEDAISQHGHAAIDAYGGVACDLRPGGFGPFVAPDLAARPAAQRIDLVVPRHNHHTVHNHRSGLQAVVGDWEGPLQLESGDVGEIHLIQAAQAVAVERAVVGRPVAQLRVGNLVDLRGSGRRLRLCEWSCPGSLQAAQEGGQVPPLLLRSLVSGHRGVLVRCDRAVLVVQQQVQLAVIRLQDQIVAALGAREAVQRASIVHLRGDRAPAVGDLGVRVGERLHQLLQLQSAPDAGEVRPVDASMA